MASTVMSNGVMPLAPLIDTFTVSVAPWVGWIDGALSIIVLAPLKVTEGTLAVSLTVVAARAPMPVFRSLMVSRPVSLLSRAPSWSQLLTESSRLMLSICRSLLAA